MPRGAQQTRPTAYQGGAALARLAPALDETWLSSYRALACWLAPVVLATLGPAQPAQPVLPAPLRLSRRRQRRVPWSRRRRLRRRRRRPSAAAIERQQDFRRRHRARSQRRFAKARCRFAPLTAVLPLCGCHRVAVRSGSSGGDVSCGKSHNVVCGPMFDFAWKVVYAEQFKLDVTRESNFRALDEQFDLMLDRCTRKCQWEAVLGKAGTDGRCDRRCRQRVAHSSRPQQLTTRQQNMYGASSVHIVEL